MIKVQIHNSGFVKQILLVAAANFLTGKLALLAAIPPGYATAIWPPSGISLAAFLLFGPRVLPGIWLGSFLLNISAGLNYETLDALFRTVAIPAGIALGSTLQAFLTGVLLKRAYGYPDIFEKGEKIISFLILSGPVGCVIAPTCGVACLYAAQIISADRLLISWSTWWAGDTVGVLVFTPLLLTHLASQKVSQRAKIILQQKAAPVAVFLLSMVVTIWYHGRAMQNVRSKGQVQFEAAVQQMFTAIERRMKVYRQVLYAGRALFAASKSVEREEWHQFVLNQDIQLNYPGIQGLGFSQYFTSSQRENVVRTVRFDGYPNFKITPEGERQEYSSIIYLEPLDERNRRAFGYDMLTEVNRRNAMERARDEAIPVLSSKITLLQENENDRQNGIILYVPVYQNGKPHNTLEERRKYFVGWVYAPFRINNLMNGILQNLPKDVYFQIYDGNNTEEKNLIYSSDKIFESLPNNHKPLFTDEKKLIVGTHEWNIYFKSLPSFEKLLDNREPELVLVGGIGISALLFFLTLMLFTTRVRAQNLAEQMTQELRKSQDHLKLQYSSIKTLSERDSLKTAGPLILKNIGEILSWEVGNFWLLDEKEQVLRCAYSWKKRNDDFLNEFLAISQQKTFVRGEGLPGRVWDSLHPACINDVTKDNNFPRSPYARKANLHGGFAFPIFAENKVLGVIEFFTENSCTLENSLIDIFSAIGAQIGQYMLRRQSESKLHEIGEFQKAILQSASYMIIATDTEGIIRTFNPAAEQCLGYSAKEMIGKLSPAVFHDLQEIEKRAKILGQELNYTVPIGFEAFVAKARLGRPDENEWTYIRKNGTRFPVMLSVTALFDINGKITGFLGVARDITERKRLEQLKNEFISTVSHELRTPLTSIRGSLGVILGGVTGSLNDQTKNMIDIAYRNCERLVRLINDILDIEKIESGKMVLKLLPHELSSLLKQSIESNRAYAEQLGVRLILKDQTPGVCINVDEDRFAQVMANLLSNACKFSPKDEEVIVTSARYQGNIRISVQDNGPGIPEEFQSRIFQKFSQADFLQGQQKGGTGLGLSISQALIEGFGGRINFETEHKVGTTFYFDIPEWQQLQSPQIGSETGKPRILICEDSPDIARILSETLSNSGLDIDIAFDTTQAKELLSKRKYSLMTLDILLPGKNGLSFLSELRELSSMRRLPVIVISVAADGGNQKVNFSELNVIAWLPKPVNSEQLMISVKRALIRSAY